MKIPQNIEEVRTLMKRMETKLGENDRVAFNFFDDTLSYSGSTEIGVDQNGWYTYSRGENWCDQVKNYKTNEEIEKIIFDYKNVMENVQEEVCDIEIEVY